MAKKTSNRKQPTPASLLDTPIIVRLTKRPSGKRADTILGESFIDQANFDAQFADRMDALLNYFKIDALDQNRWWRLACYLAATSSFAGFKTVPESINRKRGPEPVALSEPNLMKIWADVECLRKEFGGRIGSTERLCEILSGRKNSRFHKKNAGTLKNKHTAASKLISGLALDQRNLLMGLYAQFPPPELRPLPSRAMVEARRKARTAKAVGTILLD